MNKLKSIARAVFMPPLWLVVIFVGLGAAAITLSVTFLGWRHPVSYLSYPLAAYALALVSLRIPHVISFLKQAKQSNASLRKISANIHIRVKITLCITLAFNLAYSAFQLAMGIYHASLWYYFFAAYHLCLVVMRFFLLRDVRLVVEAPSTEREYRRYRFCGIVLLPMNLALALIVFYIVRLNYGISHHYIATIGLATYTFVVMTVAIVNVIRFRKYNSPVYSAAKSIALTAACVSMLTLETAMISAFGGENAAHLRYIVTLISGIAVVGFVLALAVNMIIHSTKEIKKLRLGQTPD